MELKIPAQSKNIVRGNNVTLSTSALKSLRDLNPHPSPSKYMETHTILL